MRDKEERAEDAYVKREKSEMCSAGLLRVVSGPDGGRIEGNTHEKNTHAHTQVLNHTRPLNKFIYVQLS